MDEPGGAGVWARLGERSSLDWVVVAVVALQLSVVAGALYIADGTIENPIADVFLVVGLVLGAVALGGAFRFRNPLRREAGPVTDTSPEPVARGSRSSDRG